jgi:hypothetical protein
MILFFADRTGLTTLILLGGAANQTKCRPLRGLALFVSIHLRKRKLATRLKTNNAPSGAFALFCGPDGNASFFSAFYLSPSRQRPYARFLQRFVV